MRIGGVYTDINSLTWRYILVSKIAFIPLIIKESWWYMASKFKRVSSHLFPLRELTLFTLIFVLASCGGETGSSSSANMNTMPPHNPYLGVDGTSTMHANAAASNAVSFPGPGSATQYVVNSNMSLNATMPSILMSENGALVCVGVGTALETASTPIVMLISPKTLKLLDQKILIKPESGNLAGGLYNYIDNMGRLVLVNASGELQWYSNNYNPIDDTGTLTLEKSLAIGQPLVVGLIPDYQGRVWFATQGSLTDNGPQSIVGYYDPVTNQTNTYVLPAGEMVGNSISSSPSGIAVATTSALYLFNADSQNSVENIWRTEYENSGVRKPGQLTPGTGSTPVFFGPNTGYEFLVITDNATAVNSNNLIPAEHVNIYDVTGGTLVSQRNLLASNNSGTENAPIAVGSRIFIPSTFGYWYPPPSETPSTSIPALTASPFAGGLQGMTLNGSNLLIDWGSGNTISSSALPRLSLADNLIYTVVANSETTGSGPRPSTTVDYSFAVIDASTGTIVGSPYFLSSNSFAGSYPNYLNTSSYKWNTLQMTGVISPTGVFYQGTAGGLFSVQRAEPPVPVQIDISPFNSENEVRPASNDAIFVAVHSTNVADGDALDFDATQVDLDTLKFGGIGEAANLPETPSVLDLDGDADSEAVFAFRTQDTGIFCGDTEATLTGSTYSGELFSGTDSITTIDCPDLGSHP